MKIQIGEVIMGSTGTPVLFENKTKKYLLPCLQAYGHEFVRKMESIVKIAVGIGDFVISNRKIKQYERHLFIMVDTTLASTHFMDFLKWVREEPTYEDDYVYGDMNRSKYHMIVIKFPEKFYTAFQLFPRGNYSEMYSKENIELFFKSNPSKSVLIKDHNYKVSFIRQLNKEFGTTINPHDKEFDPNEYDLPPDEREEKFNHHLKKK